MASTLLALFDDIAVLMKATASSMDDIAIGAAKASSKSAAVVIDDAAITPQYVQGISANRELPVIWRIARGSIINKFLIIIPIAMLLSLFAPWVLPYLLIAGGAYLVFEGAEKILTWMKVIHPHGNLQKEDVISDPKQAEDKIVKSAVTTDLVLSTEIMLISMANLNIVDNWVSLLVALSLIAIAMTIAVYGSVALLVRFDDMGMAIGKNNEIPKYIRTLGFSTAKNMLKVFTVIGVIGVVAMLWVGGHLLLANVATLGFSVPYDAVVTASQFFNSGFVSWFVDALLSGIVGLISGSIFVGIFFGMKKLFKKK